MWSRLTNGHEDSAAGATARKAASQQNVSADVCKTLRSNAAASVTADPASCQMTIDEMKRSGCSDIPSL